jgi:hypothetical protein
MPTYEHEGLVELFQDRRLLAVELAEALGIKLPAWRQAVSDATDIPDRVASRHADAVIKLTDSDDQAVFAFVVEVQLRPDDGKEWTWPVYLSGVRDRLRCPVALLVICVDNATATRAAEPIELGPGSVVVPWVVGPTQVPMVTDRDDAGRSPQLAVLSAIAHGSDPARRQVLDAVVAAYEAAGPERAAMYHDLVAVGLPMAALRHLEARMAVAGTYQYQSEFARRYFSQGEAKGEVKGEAKALLKVLSARGIEVPDDARERIIGCADLDQLETWVSRAATATSIHDLFA